MAYPYLETVAPDYVVLGQLDRFDPDDPGAIASAMRHALDQFSEDIARELRSLPLDSR